MKNKKGIFIGIGIFLAVVALIVAVLLLNKPKDEEEIKNKLNSINKRPDVILNDDGVAKYVGKDEVTVKVEDKNDVFEVMEEVGDYFKIENPKDVLEIKTVQESGDFTFYKLSQIYDGVKVYGNELVITVNKDKEVTSITGKYIPISKASTYSSTSITEMKEKLSNILNEPYELLSEAKYIYIKEEKPIYCYAYTIANAEGIYEVLIDAKEAVEVKRFAQSDSADYSYTGKDIYGNDRTISINEMAIGGYQLHDNNRNITIVDATNFDKEMDGLIDGVTTFIPYLLHLKLLQAPAVVNICDNGTLSTDICLTKDTNFIRNSIAGMDNFAKTYDFYNDVLERKSYNNNGSEIFVNIGVVTGFWGNKEYKNAIWDNDNKLFLFGSKNDISYAAALDIVAHEYTHAVSRDIVNFTYFGESGSLSESYSDIMGSLVEGKNFQIGEDIGTLRDMTNPNSYGDPMVKDGKYYFPSDTERYNENFKAFFSDGKWEEWDHGGVHTNSGVPNYAAFLMYDNKAFESKEEMAKVWYTSLYLLSSNADFEDCALAVIQTAKNYELSEDKIKIIEDAFKTTKMLDEDYGSLSGKVKSSLMDTALYGVVVTAISSLNPHVYFQTTTDEYGTYKFEELPTTDYLITFEMPKYKNYEEKVMITKDGNKSLDVKLDVVEEPNYKDSEIVFVLDVSLSMDKSDPTNITKHIIHNVLSSLGSDSNVALVTFTAKAKIINNGLSNKDVDKKILITDVFNMANDNGHNDDSGTNGRIGLEKGLSLFSKSSKTRKYIVFLTDGEDNKDTGPTYDEIIKQSKDMGIRILTIGLGKDNQINEQILIKLANDTNGKYYHATKSSNLYEFDRRIFAELN